MADILVHNGFKGNVTVDIDSVETTIFGLSGFSISEDARSTIDVPTTFNTERDQVIVQQKGVITFTATGFTIFSDEGQDFIRSAYDDETELTSLKFYIDATNYYQASLGDYIRITSIGEVATDAQGFASYSFTGVFFDDYEKQTTS